MQAMPSACRWCDTDLVWGGKVCWSCRAALTDATITQINGGRWDGAWRVSKGSVSAYGDSHDDAVHNFIQGTLTVKDWNEGGGNAQ